jgi:hypothetical protein
LASIAGGAPSAVSACSRTARAVLATTFDATYKGQSTDARTLKRRHASSLATTSVAATTACLVMPYSGEL